MSDGSDSAGGVGSDGGNSGASLAADTASNAADSVADALGAAVDSLSSAISDALGAVADAAGLADALGAIGDMLGIDSKDLQGIVGAALMGAITGGLPGAIAAVAQGLVGGTLSEVARDATSSLPAEMRGAVQAAIDNWAGGIPGAFASGNLQGVLGNLATGALTNGRAPSVDSLGDLARSVTGLADAARGTFDNLSQGNFAGAVEAASAFDAVLGSQFAESRAVIGDVANAFGAGNGAYPSNGRGDFGDAVEAVALSAGRLLSQ